MARCRFEFDTSSEHGRRSYIYILSITDSTLIETNEYETESNEDGVFEDEDI